MAQRNENGSALLVAVVVMLVLSGVGMGIIALTDSDRADTSWNSHAKNALYVAEIGLRRGETVLAGTPNTAAAISTLLSNTSTSQTTSISPYVPVIPQDPTQYDLTRLGTYLETGGVELANQQVTLPASPTGRPLPDAFYSLYIRNNPNDGNVANFSGLAAVDSDFVVNLVSVAWIARAGNILAVKILEEEYAWAAIDQDPSAQKLKDAGGTSSAQFGG